MTYAHVNEARFKTDASTDSFANNLLFRNNWRPYLTEVVDRILSDHLDISDTNLEIEDVVRRAFIK